MSTDFSNIGFDVKSSEDVYNLIEKCSDDRKRYYKFKDRNFMVIKPDSNSELYYYGDSEGINGAFCEIYYDSPHVITGENWGWVSKPEGELSPELIQVYVDNGKTDFPLNVMIPDSFVYADLKLSDRLKIKMTWFAQDVEVYKSADDFHERSGSIMSEESCIPCGTFPLLGKEDEFVPSAEAIMAGVVTFAEKRINEFSHNEYWFITVTCCGHVFDIVADCEFVKDTVEEGNVIYGMFWISGRILDDSLLYKQDEKNIVYTCPNCGAVLNDQTGFDSAHGTWNCTKCGMLLMDDDVYEGDTFKGVAWFCDNCGALLNRQEGFTDSTGSWECTACGYQNSITAGDITE